MAGLGAESFSKVMLSGFVSGDSTNKAAGVIPAYAGATPGKQRLAWVSLCEIPADRRPA